MPPLIFSYTSKFNKAIPTEVRISVVIPCFNNSAHLEETLESLINQELKEWECVIVDDGSTDNSTQIVSKFEDKDKRFKLFHRPSSYLKGANSCRNYGAELAKGDFLLFLDADDLLSQNCLDYRLSKLNSELDLAIFHTGNFLEKTEDSTPFSNLLSSSNSVDEYLDLFLDYQIPWHTSSGLWRKEFFNKINGFDTDLQRFQDVDLHVRALNSKEVRIWVDEKVDFTSFYRKSTFHTQISLEKRRFVLDQGILFLQKLKNEGVLFKTFGLLLYLMFRFEEVLNSSDLKVLQSLFKEKTERLPIEAKMMFLLEGKYLKSPSRIRKVLSFGIYKLYRRKRN